MFPKIGQISWGYYQLQTYFQGATIKFLVNLLKIDKKKDDAKKITEEVNDNIIEHIMSGIDLISGRRGNKYFHVSTK